MFFHIHVLLLCYIYTQNKVIYTQNKVSILLNVNQTQEYHRDQGDVPKISPISFMYP